VQLVAVVVAALAAGVVLTLGYWRHSDIRLGVARGQHTDDRLTREQVATRVVVSMASGEGFAGLLVDQDARTLKLREAMGVSRTGERAPVDGEVLIPRAEVAYVQRPAAG
jgi:hypothetical protein